LVNYVSKLKIRDVPPHTPAEIDDEYRYMIHDLELVKSRLSYEKESRNDLEKHYQSMLNYERELKEAAKL
jgi:hypothetical protein